MNVLAVDVLAVDVRIPLVPSCVPLSLPLHLLIRRGRCGRDEREKKKKEEVTKKGIFYKATTKKAENI